MAQVMLKGNPVHLSGESPKVGSKSPDFVLVDSHLKDKRLADFKGMKKVIAVVPSLDTPTCSTMTKKLNQEAKNCPGVVFLVVSADLPFAQKRSCTAESMEDVITLSMMRSKEFGKDWGLLIQDGPLAGILTRALFVLDSSDKVAYAQVVAEITEEPDYAAAIAALKKVL